MKKLGFFKLLSGAIEYRVQWEAFQALCGQNGVNADMVLDLLVRARKAVKA